MSYKGFWIEGDNGKEMFLTTPSREFRVSINIDDCDTLIVANYTQAMIAILNDHWADRDYNYLFNIPKGPPEHLTEEEKEEWWEGYHLQGNRLLGRVRKGEL